MSRTTSVKGDTHGTVCVHGPRDGAYARGARVRSRRRTTTKKRAEATEAEAEAPPDEADARSGRRLEAKRGRGAGSGRAGDNGERRAAQVATSGSTSATCSCRRSCSSCSSTRRRRSSTSRPVGVAVNIWNRDDGGPSFQIGIGYTSYAFDGSVPRHRRSGRGHRVPATARSGLVHLTGSILWNTPIIEEML